ncbi:MAG: YbjN domain-containing protein [Anaerolineae bacterium]|nr:YbjN domain-containing protein [Anaerolineae bacterium]
MRMGEQQIFNVMIAFFEEDRWDIQWMTGRPVLSMNFNGNSGSWTCYAQAREKQQQFVFYSVLPINVPEEKRHNISEFITRANYGMIMGNFELDFADGEVRYKTSIDVEGTSLTHPLIRQVVYANVMIMDRYMPGLMKVIFADQSPAEVIAEIEAQNIAPEDLDEDDTHPPSPNGSRPH